MEAESGESALDLLTQHDESIDLLLTDVVMPQMDGPTLIRTAREKHPKLKVICISGYAEEALRKRLENLTEVSFLPKPFTLDVLASAVKESLRQGA